jgi:hypothetical protein
LLLLCRPGARRPPEAGEALRRPLPLHHLRLLRWAPLAAVPRQAVLAAAHQRALLAEAHPDRPIAVQRVFRVLARALVVPAVLERDLGMRRAG